MNNSTGPLGEAYTAEYLRKRGLTVLCRNYRSRFGEIDLIAADARFLVFTEVKTRLEGSLEDPLEAVTPGKQRRIAKTAMLYLQQNPTRLQPRFDVAAVTTKNGVPVSVRYLENAFFCPAR